MDEPTSDLPGNDFFAPRREDFLAAVFTPQGVCGQACQALSDQGKACSKTCTSAKGHGGIHTCGGPHG